MGASFVLLFNIIEIFNINQNQEKFSFNIDREKISEKIFNALKSDLNETENIEEFKNINPTAENIVILIWNKIRAKLATDLELKVTLYETLRNFVEYAGE